MRPGDTIRIGIELYSALFYQPKLTQLRVLLNLKKTNTAQIDVFVTSPTAHGVEYLKYKNYLVTSTCPIDLGFTKKELYLANNEDMNKGKDRSQRSQYQS